LVTNRIMRIVYFQKGFLPVVSFCVERSNIIVRAQRFHKSEIRNLKSKIITPLLQNSGFLIERSTK